MKKILFVILILFIIFSGLIVYEYKYKEVIPILKIEEDIIDINQLYIYGTHLNMRGNLVDGKNIQLVLYNGKFIEINITKDDGEFYLSKYLNEGIYLDSLPRGKYYLFLRSKETDNDGNDLYKYYSLHNLTEYKETVYYTLTNTNNKIIIGSEDTYPTMFIDVIENKDKDTELYDIVLDPGHGGLDSGAKRGKYWESNYTMDIALKTKKILEEKGLKVKLTREKDQLKADELLPEYGIGGRAVIPHEVRAKYVFSIHINSNLNKNVNGLEVYTAKNINYDFAKKMVENIVNTTGLNYSNNKTHKIFNGIYSRNFTEREIANSKEEYKKKNMVPYDITDKSNYFYIIRETGGIATGAYVDGRNTKIPENPYTKSNIGSEAYLIEFGFLSNSNDLDNLNNKLDSYVQSLSDSIYSLYDVN